MGKSSLKDAFSSPTIRKGLALGLFFIFMITIAGMSVLAGNASTTLVAMIDAIYDWREIIALGIALGVATSFMRG